MLITAKHAWSPQNINALTRTLNEGMCPCAELRSNGAYPDTSISSFLRNRSPIYKRINGLETNSNCADEDHPQFNAMLCRTYYITDLTVQNLYLLMLCEGLQEVSLQDIRCGPLSVFHIENTIYVT